MKSSKLSEKAESNQLTDVGSEGRGGTFTGVLI
jgi:hypothetical protein